MNKREEIETESKSDADEQHADEQEQNTDPKQPRQPETPLIDHGLAGSVNAALHDNDD
jgi:hypothetical protein